MNKFFSLLVTLGFLVATFVFCYTSLTELAGSFAEKKVACIKELGPNRIQLCRDFFQLPYEF